ncbi:MAG: inosine/xanthosine triphosphatase [Patescibacteria group bacterium]
MKKVCVVSQNPIKVDAVKLAFIKMFPQESFNFFGFTAPSGVGDQPMNDKETKQGSLNRVQNAVKLYQNYDFYIALEGGVEKQESGYYECFAWACILHEGIMNFSKSGTFLLPKKVGELIEKGTELGKADDIVFGRENSKQGNGSVGILTSDAITRTSYYTETVCLALIPFKNMALYI